MSLKDNFQQQDWRTLQFSFLWTFDAVAGIDGESDDKEQQTMQQVLAEAHHHPLAIFSEVLVSLESSFHSLHQDFHRDPRSIDAGLQQTMEICVSEFPLQRWRPSGRRCCCLDSGLASPRGDPRPRQQGEPGGAAVPPAPGEAARRLICGEGGAALHLEHVAQGGAALHLEHVALGLENLDFGLQRRMRASTATHPWPGGRIFTGLRSISSSSGMSVTIWLTRESRSLTASRSPGGLPR